MIKIVRFSDIESDIVSHIGDKRLIPIIGSGFTARCQARNGAVPSGTVLKDYMAQSIMESMPDVKLDKSLGLARVASYYNKLITKEAKREYLRDHFTDVRIDQLRRAFLDIDWLYVYTLNIDDGIEMNSQFKQIVDSNKDIDFSILHDKRCVLKLHGDALSSITYLNYSGEIFDLKQYAASINTNHSLLNHLKHDFAYKNLVFIGCSLDDEFDLTSLQIENSNDEFGKTNRYYCSVTEPDYFKQIELEDLGVTHICVFDDFDEIYRSFVSAFYTSTTLSTNSIDIYKSFKSNNIPSGYQINKDYLFHNKSLMDEQNQIVNIPFYFTTRLLAQNILRSLTTASIHVVDGMPVSGKTYLLTSLKLRVNDRDVYFFNSRSTLNSETLAYVLKKANCLLLFDANSISKEQIYEMLHNANTYKHNNTVVVIAINKSDKDVTSIINTQKENLLISGYSLKTKFSSVENEEINKKLALSELPQFTLSKTILDNLVHFEKTFRINGRFSKVEPSLKSAEDLMVLILLAVKDKLYAYELVNYNIRYAAQQQIIKAAPCISFEHNMFYEKDIMNPSDFKIVVNSKFWLYESLGEYAKIKQNHDTIVEAFRRIIQVNVETYRKRSYFGVLDFLKFEVINALFPSDSKGQLGLIRKIYDGIQEYVVAIPFYYYHYYHQRAVAYFRQNKPGNAQIDQLVDARRFLLLAKVRVQNEMEHSTSSKLAMTYAHILFTMSLVLSRISCVYDFKNEQANTEALRAIANAADDSYNINAFTSEDIIDIHRIVRSLSTLGTSTENSKTLQNIIMFLRSIKNIYINDAMNC